MTGKRRIPTAYSSPVAAETAIFSYGWRGPGLADTKPDIDPCAPIPSRVTLSVALRDG